jgi:hypothetical protein
MQEKSQCVQEDDNYDDVMREEICVQRERERVCVTVFTWVGGVPAFLNIWRCELYHNSNCYENLTAEGRVGQHHVSHSCIPLRPAADFVVHLHS